MTELIKWSYFGTLIIYFIQSIVAPRSSLYLIIVTIAIFLHGFFFFGWSIIPFLLVTGIVSTISELISLKTSLNVFGVSYSYNLTSGYFRSRIVIGGAYPMEIAVAWILFMYISFFLVSLLCASFGVHGILKAVFSALALVSFDILIDPVAVQRGAWKWNKAGFFFGIPWRNFFGWILIGFVISLIFVNLTPNISNDSLMTVPVLILWALFPIIFGRILFQRNKILGFLATLPLSIFFLFGLRLL
ncbi:MAG: carotenoid biosynthesis protein [Patescibacteria group bacterium]